MDLDPIYELPGGSSVIPPARSAQARHALIVAGIKEFSERGVDGASARRVAEMAGQNVAAVTYYFGGKEGLYLAIATYAAETVMRRSAPLLDEIEAYLARPNPAPAQCLRFLQQMLNGTLVGSDALFALSQLIVREQTHPTAAFDVLFRGALARHHELGTALIAAYAGGPADDAEFVIHYHLLLGSVLGLRVARETLLRRTGWSDIGDAERSQISQLLSEHVASVVRGLRTQRRRRVSDRPSKPGSHR
ncbi:MAG: transcriptional regulator CecR [Burkholderiaceae bacterium]